MPKYFVSWEIDTSKVPISREERAAAWGPMIQLGQTGYRRGENTRVGRICRRNERLLYRPGNRGRDRSFQPAVGPLR